MRMVVRTVTMLLGIGLLSQAQAQNASWPKSLTLGTASPGGVYYVYGEAVARLLTENLKVTVNHLPTQGPVHNVKLVESGGAQLGMITMGVGLQGWNGTGDWAANHRFRNMRALFPMYDTTFQFVALRRSGITTVTQFDKKNVGVGPRAGTGGAYVPAMLSALGISSRIGNGSFAAVASDLLEGRYDAIVMAAGVPFPALKEIEAKEPLLFVRLTPEQTETIRKAMPELTDSQIEKGVYSSLDRPYTTLGVYNFAIGRADLPEDLVYQLVKAIHSNAVHAALLKAHPTAAETIPQNATKNTFLPFHPGALRYYREAGIKIPDSLVPTN